MDMKQKGIDFTIQVKEKYFIFHSCDVKFNESEKNKKQIKTMTLFIM